MTLVEAFECADIFPFLLERHVHDCVNNLKRDTLETRHAKFENSRHGLIESIH